MCVEKDRLDACQADLVARGFKDVKFFFGPTANKPLSALATEAADVLEAILKTRYSDLKPFGDSATK